MSQKKPQENYLSPELLENLQHDFAARLKDLEQREAALKKAEKQLSSINHDIAIAERTLELRREQQAEELASHTSALRGIEQSKKALDKNVDTLAESVKAHYATIDQLKLQESAERAKVNAYRKERIKIDAEIENRKLWLTNQEKVIADTIEDGNLQIKSLHYEIQDIAEQRDEINMELHQLNKNKGLVIDELAYLERERDDLDAQNNALSAKLQEKEATLRERIAGAKAKLTRVIEETDEKLKILKTEEEAIRAKRAAMRKETNDIVTARRRLQSTENLYNI